MDTTITVGLGGYSLLQAPNMTNVQMMSYILESPRGNLLVVDGGNPGDADYLRSELEKRGGHVSLWLLTHCHDDHYSALSEIMQNPGGVTVERIGYNFPPQEWIDAVEPMYRDLNGAIYALLAEKADICTVLYEGMVLDFDGVKIEVLNDPMDFQAFTEPSPNNGSNVNDTSLVFRFTFPNGKTLLFLGDLGLRAGNIPAERYGEKLKSDIVQMAHHGQNGADENVYKLIQPEVCLWTAPLWLYNNDRGGGYNTAHYKTVIVRGWMEKLGVKHHAVEGDGPVILK